MLFCASMVRPRAATARNPGRRLIPAPALRPALSLILGLTLCLTLGPALCPSPDGILPGSAALAAAPSNARRTGLEPPGGPRPLEALPGNAAGGAAEGGKGHTDAYGNPVGPREPEEKTPRKRPLPGAYGGYGRQEDDRPLPDPEAENQAPAWSFK